MSNQPEALRMVGPMNRDDIINWAREVGWTSYDSQDERFERFAALVRADEREACAKVAEEFYYEGPASSEIAEAIRERSQS